MATIPTFTAAGSKKEQGTAADKQLFGLEANHHLLALAYRSYLANGRSARPQTLTRGLVRGGGKKPWRQKGTGRARVGSIRVPQWRGGGVVFGPTGLENHAIKLTRKMRRLSVAQALSAKAKAGQLIIIEKLVSKDGKVKSMQPLLNKLKLTGQTLLVSAQRDELVDRATRNLPNVQLITARYLSVYHLLNADQVVLTKDALDQLQQWLGGGND